MYNHTEPENQKGTIISTNPVVNLTATFASVSFLFALFLCFADAKSKTIRRYSVQSVGLGAVSIACGLLTWILWLLVEYIPIVNMILQSIVLALYAFLMILILILRIRMMWHAYRGLAYVSPVLGETFRKFE